MTRGQLPQRAGLPGLNGGGAAAAVPPGVVLLHKVHYPTIQILPVAVNIRGLIYYTQNATLYAFAAV